LSDIVRTPNLSQISLTTEAMIKKEQLREDIDTFSNKFDVSKFDSAVAASKDLIKGGVPPSEINLDFDLIPAIKSGFKTFPELAQHEFVAD
jgi:hypothetical protein